MIYAFYDRVHSLRRSIRESFRQRRNSAGAADRRKIAESLNLDGGQSSSRRGAGKLSRPRASSEPTSPVANTAGVSIVNASQVSCTNLVKRVHMYILKCQVSSELAGVVSHICFSDTHVSGGGTSPALFAATMGSSVIRYQLTLPDPRERLSVINKAFIAGKFFAFLILYHAS